MKIKELKETIKKEDGIYDIYEYISDLEFKLGFTNKMLEEKEKEINRLNELLK